MAEKKTANEELDARSEKSVGFTDDVVEPLMKECVS